MIVYLEIGNSLQKIYSHGNLLARPRLQKPIFKRPEQLFQLLRVIFESSADSVTMARALIERCRVTASASTCLRMVQFRPSLVGCLTASHFDDAVRINADLASAGLEFRVARASMFFIAMLRHHRL